MSARITPFLFFNDRVDDAVKFYTAVFSNSIVIQTQRAGPDGPVISATFELEGQRFHAMNGGPHFSFSNGVSFFVSCMNQAEVDYYWERLLADGGEPLRCGWLKDQFGLNWQVVPEVLRSMLTDPDPARAQRAMQAMLAMTKLDISKLEQARDNT